MQKIKNANHPQGVATFFNKKLFENVAEFSRNRTLTTVLKDEQERYLAIVNCHLEGAPSKGGERTKQLSSTIHYLNKHHKHHAVVVCGDFNCQNGASTSSAYLSLGYVPLLNSMANEHGNQDKMSALPVSNGEIITTLPASTNTLPVHIISVKNDYCLVNNNQWIHASNIYV